MVEPLRIAGETLEKAGASILKRLPITELAGNLVSCGKELETLSLQIAEIAPEQSDGTVSSQRMAYAAQKMIEAGNELQGTPKSKTKGKGWLKG